MLVLLLGSFLFFTSAQILKDKISSLPGAEGPIGNQYSGYIEVDNSHGRKLHYWFVESQGNPATDPLILWLNGGKPRL
jgi:carboxypeptidase C (cathepsin A)